MADSQEIVVVGGGLAGSSLALRLARAGRQVLLLERSQGPHHKVCGEFLSWEALHYLRNLGLDPEDLGGVPITHVRLASQQRLSEAALPFAAVSLSRFVLDEALLQAAIAAGVEVRRGVHVGGLQSGSVGWQVSLREGDPVQARDVFLATGKHDLHTLPRPGGTHSGLVGFKMYYRLQPDQASALANAVELFLFPGGYAGLQQVEGGRANLCPLMDAEKLRLYGGTWSASLQHMLANAPHLAQRLQGAEPLFAAPLAIASIPYGHVQRETKAGLWRVGDQAAVIPSFSGDGMSIALHSAAVAAERYLQGAASIRFQQELAGEIRSRMRLATALSRLLVCRPWAAHLLHAFPSVLPRIASMTRIPAGRLLERRTVRVDSLRQGSTHE